MTVKECPISWVVFTGTKAQFIKMVPILVELERRGEPYRIIDTGQHAELVEDVIRQYRLRKPELSLAPGKRGVATLTGGVWWMLRLSRILLWSSPRLRRELFADEKAICLVHGDTMSALLSALIAKRAGQQVAHVEAGLRSFDFLNPFPEELVRVLVMRLSDHLFVPSQQAFENTKRMGLSDRAYLLPANTGLDTLVEALQQEPGEFPAVPKPYALATIHRMETLFRKNALLDIVDIVLAAHRHTPVVWVEHPPTVKRLTAYGLDETLAEAGVIRVPLLPHPTFAHLLRGARFVLTDGGSVQEEAYYLGRPCLILRRSTERNEGIGKNAVLSKLDRETAEVFLEDPDRFQREERLAPAGSPSKAIVDFLCHHRGIGRVTS